MNSACSTPARLLGAACLTPYVLRLLKTSAKPGKISPTVAAVAGFFQNGVSGIVWVIGLATRTQAPSDAAVWTAIVAMAVLFAAGHLPATRSVTGKITSVVLARALALNGPIAILCGWLFWRYGIETAMTAHFSADIVYHVGGTALLQANDRRRFLNWFPPPQGQ